MISRQQVQRRGQVLAVGQRDLCLIHMPPKMPCRDRPKRNNNSNNKCNSRPHRLHMAGHSLSSNNKCTTAQLQFLIIRILVTEMVAMAIKDKGKRSAKSPVMILLPLGTS